MPEQTQNSRLAIKRTVAKGEPTVAADLLATWSGLSKSAVKDAMVKGAVWVRKGGRGKNSRLRRATAALKSGDQLEFYYDRELLSRKAPLGRCIDDRGRYSVWYKPAGLLAQGTEYGDHCALQRQVEIDLRPRNAFLVHRLDREASGLMVFAHDGDAAAKLSALFAGDGVEKQYRVQVRGIPGAVGTSAVIDEPLDGKTARSEYRVMACDAEADTATLAVTIHTGRLHQIRRHLLSIGHPVIGDPRYGHGNKAEGMRLVACKLAFRCPLTGKSLVFVLPEEDIVF